MHDGGEQMIVGGLALLRASIYEGMKMVRRIGRRSIGMR